MANVGLIGAWQAWLAGRSLSGYTLWGMPLFWWGRIGKIAEFAGGVTVILDLIGPERLRAYGQRIRPKRRYPNEQEDLVAGILAPTCFMVVISIAFTICGFLAVALLAVLGEPPDWVMPLRAAPAMIGSGFVVTLCAAVYVGVPRMVAAVLDRARPAYALRIAALLVLAVGFQFDLLAS